MVRSILTCVFIIAINYSQPGFASGLSTEEAYVKNQIARAWFEHQYKNCPGPIASVEQAPFEYVNELNRLNNDVCSGDKINSEACFAAVDGVKGLHETYTRRAREYRCVLLAPQAAPPSPQVASLGDVSAVCKYADKNKLAVGKNNPDWCQQKASCESDFQIRNHRIEKGDYIFLCAKNDDGACPSSIYDRNCRIEYFAKDSLSIFKSEPVKTVDQQPLAVPVQDQGVSQVPNSAAK